MKSPAAFISYARRDDRAYSRRITGIRERLQGLVGAAIGWDFEIFQDCEGIAWGQHWRSRLAEALDEALFLIPILTPSYFNSEACQAELETFLELERQSGRKDRVLSLYFVTAPVYEQKTDPLAAILQERQHRDWRHLRIDPLGSAKVMRALDSLAGELAAAIHARQAGTSPPDVVAQTPAPETTPRIPRGREVRPPTRERTGTEALPERYLSLAQLRTAMRAAQAGEGEAALIRAGIGRDAARRSLQSLGLRREIGKAFRDIEAPWCPELVVIPAGSFVMGSPEQEEEHSPDEGPQHEVRFAQPFALGRYPVTFEEYDHYCAETKRKKPEDQGWGRGRRPVIKVSWEEATAYVEWLSKQTGQPYRLPSEAEWEYACRAGTRTPFWTGATISTAQANYDGNYTYESGRKGEYRARTTSIDTFEANPWSLHDMHGNVWEWCEDCWNHNYEGAPADGSAWTSGDCGRRVSRGGSWNDNPRVLRSAYRDRSNTDSRYLNTGFRVARTLTP